MSTETTPTLCHSIPAFESFINRWEGLLEDRPQWYNIVQPGLDKLEDYQEKLNQVHVLAMGEIKSDLFFTIELI